MHQDKKLDNGLFSSLVENTELCVLVVGHLSHRPISRLSSYIPISEAF